MRCTLDAILDTFEQATDVFGRSQVLVGDHIGVVPGHVNSRPAKAGLLLTLGHDPAIRSIAVA
jgi:hypothetical protein